MKKIISIVIFICLLSYINCLAATTTLTEAALADQGLVCTSGDCVMDTITVDSYERHIQVPARASGLPADQAPLKAVGTASCMSFANAGGKYGYFQWEIPTDWVGGTEDIVIEVDWIPESGAIGASETVIHKFSYRAIAEGEVLTTGTEATVQATYTDSGSGTAQYHVEHTGATLTYNHADQPLEAEDHLYVKIERDTDTFAGDTCVTAFEIIYNSNTIPTTN